jgi:cell division protein FtsL
MTNVEKMIVTVIVVLAVFVASSIFICNKLVKEVSTHGGLKSVSHQIWNGTDTNAKANH